jgi:cobalt/nickel transport protein
MTTATRRNWLFWIGFALAALVIAGGASDLASSSPDGLDSATLKGCDVVDNNGVEVLAGDCIAQHAQEHTMANSPLADYAIEGGEGTRGLAGVIGVVVTLAVAGTAFWLIARTRPKSTAGG